MRDAMTFRELMAKFDEAVPYLDDKTAEILAKRPELTNHDGGEMLGRLVAIAMLDFLAWAFEVKGGGYRPEPRDG